LHRFDTSAVNIHIAWSPDGNYIAVGGKVISEMTLSHLLSLYIFSSLPDKKILPEKEHEFLSHCKFFLLLFLLL